MDHGTGHGIAEEMLARTGVTRPILLELRHFAAVPYIVSRSDLVVTVTDKLAEVTRYRFALTMREHQLPLPEIPIKVFWHRRFHQDAGNRWLCVPSNRRAGPPVGFQGERAGDAACLLAMVL